MIHDLTPISSVDEGRVDSGLRKLGLPREILIALPISLISSAL